jgi:hypothetical protein
MSNLIVADVAMPGDLSHQFLIDPYHNLYLSLMLTRVGTNHATVQALTCCIGYALFLEFEAK